MEQRAVTTQQPDRLVAAARRAEIKHGTEHLVDVEDVKVYPQKHRAPREAVLAQARFCNCSVIPKKLLGGVPDSQDISEEVFLDGKISVPHITREGGSRTYRLENVVFSTNGRTVLRATKQTRFVRTDIDVVDEYEGEEEHFSELNLVRQD